MHSLSEHTAQCRHCVKRTSYQPYLAFYQAQPYPTTKPAACPRCGRTCPIATPDYADTLCLDNVGLTRLQALNALEVVYRRNAHVASPRTYQYVEDYLATEHNLKSWPSIRTLTTPLSVSCHSCGGSYVFYRNAPDIQQTPPLYCVWCASPNTHVTCLDTEDTAWVTLAQHYDLPVATLKAVYASYASQSKYTTLQSFIEQPLITAMLNLTRQQQEAVS